MFDIKGVQRYIVGYEKQPNKFGGYDLAIEYDFARPISLSFLQKLFGIDPADPDGGTRYLISCYIIDEEKAKALQPFVKEKIDLTKYSFMLECRASD